MMKRRREEELQASATIAEVSHSERRRTAELSSEDIAQMSRAELAEAIRGSKLPLDRHVQGDLEFYGRDTLERLMFLARQMCRRQCPGKPR